MAKVKVVNNLGRFIDEKERKAYRALVQSCILITSEASYRTPIDTNVLVNSYLPPRIDREGTKLVGTVTNNAKYAAYVHDPNVKQNFVRDSATKEFLKVGGDAAKPMIDKIIKGAMKT